MPVALACTSGTAAANYAPAVIEAHEARVPLLVLTADRPPELRELGAGQTIDQVKLYGSAAKWYLEVDDHPATPERMRWLRQLACRAFWTALEGRPGPVHLNFALREPLVLDAPLPRRGAGRRRARRRAAVGDAAARRGRRPPRRCSTGCGPRSTPRPRAVLVAGRGERDPGLGEALAALAERARLPLLADPLSGARRGPAAVAHYDALLRDAGWAAAHGPDLVLRVGDLPTSKPLRQWLHGLDDALQVAFDPEAAWQDPAGAVATIVAADPRALAPPARAAPRRDRGWLDAWRTRRPRRRRGDRGRAGADAVASRASRPSSACACRPRPRSWSRPRCPCATSRRSSRARDAPPRVLANRGANGIDGTVSTAFGVAAAARGPTVLLIGDVALAHDVGGLLAARRLGLAARRSCCSTTTAAGSSTSSPSPARAPTSRSTSPPRTGSTSRTPPRSTASPTSASSTPEAFRAALDRALRRADDHRGPDRPRGERRAPPARLGSGRAVRPRRA